ncbi:MAG: SigB/SigF/SigG family RNA polymerase sigma factor [Solirubrobacteraceae bacterium]|nr:SigB/SigF/SigG family RNA polymerase sigma factor [Solirubrobacteraceae bacterium]
MAAPNPTAACADGEADAALAQAAGDRRAREDLRLFRAWVDQGDRRARAQLIERFLPLARSLARRYERGAEPLEDLVQVASVALVKAIDRYDPARGYAFSSFAVPTIAGELKRHFRDQTWMVRPPRGIQEVTLRVEGALARLTQQLDRSPTTRELADAVGVDDEAILEAMQARSARGALSLHAPQGDPADAMSLQDTLGAVDPDIERAETRAELDRLMTEVSPRAREMLRMRFEEDMTQAEIGAAIGISQMQVSRILRQTIAKLREVAGAGAQPDEPTLV